jgi:hypothetical protein
MKIDHKRLFDGLRASMHGGSLSEAQVASYEAILYAARTHGVTDPRHLSYIFSTTRGEVGSAMQPVREVGRGQGKRYGVPDPSTGEVYFGRGFVQITWADNYRKLGKRLGLPLYEEPDLALKPEIAAKILVIGMVEGIFTGKKLSDYINDKGTNYREARRIINIMDRADEFAELARRYEAVIRAALITEGKGEVKDVSATVTIAKPAPKPDPAPAPEPPPETEAQPHMSAAQVIVGVIAAAAAAIFGWIFMGGE